MTESSAVRRSVRAVTAVALLYSGLHFAQSGVLFPLRQQNLAKFDELTPALREHLETGQPVHFTNAIQYGPVFFFVAHPLLVWTPSVRALSNWLYGLQLVCIALAFLLTYLTLKPLIGPEHRPLITAWLLVLWLNFAPLYTILAVKGVETWELFLLSLALYAYVRAKTWVMASALSVAALVKVLPMIFLYYLLITNRRAFASACAVLLAVLLVSHAIYGRQMGLMYFPHLVKSAAGESFGLTWHENISLKAAIAKLFGRLDTPDIAAGRGGSTIVLTSQQMQTATMIGDVAVLVGLALLTVTWLRSGTRSRDTILWEWSVLTVAMLILSPNTTFEYATLALGATSYAVVRASVPGSAIGARSRPWLLLGGALFLLGALLPRQLLNRLTFADAIRRWSGYTHLTPSEVYQYYCFPLLGLLLLVAALWRLQPLRSRSAADRVEKAVEAFS